MPEIEESLDQVRGERLPCKREYVSIGDMVICIDTDESYAMSIGDVCTVKEKNMSTMGVILPSGKVRTYFYERFTYA